MSGPPPAYFCTNEDSTSELKREGVLVALDCLFFLLMLFVFMLTLYLLTTFVIIVYKWGAEDGRHLHETTKGSKKILLLREGFFSELHLPVSVSIGGVICAEEFVGGKAALRLKGLILLIIVTVLCTFFPIYTECELLTPTQQQNATTRIQVKNQETFGKGEYRTAGNSILAVTYTVPALTVFCLVVFLDPSVFSKRDKPIFAFMEEIARLPMRTFASVLMLPFSLSRVIAHWPSPPWQRKLNSTNLLTYIFVAVPLWLIIWLILSPCFVALAFVLDVLGAATACLTFPYLITIIVKTHSLKLQEGLFSFRSRKLEALMTSRGVMKCFIVYSALFVFFMAFVNAAQLLLCFTLLTFLGIWMNYPVQATLVLIWISALIGELQKTSNDYYAPLQTVWKIYIDAVRKMALEGDHRPRKLLWDGDPLSYDLDISETTGQIDWKVFLSETEKTYHASCLDLLKKECPRYPFTIVRTLVLTRKDDYLFAEGYKDKDFSTWTAISLSNKVEEEGVIVGPSEELPNLRTDGLTHLQAVLRMRFFIRLFKTIGFIIPLILILVLLISFNMLWENPKDPITIFLQYLFLPLFVYYRATRRSLTFSKHDIECIREVVTERLEVNMEAAKQAAATSASDRAVESAGATIQANETSDTIADDSCTNTCYRSRAGPDRYSCCLDFLRESWKQACPFATSRSVTNRESTRRREMRNSYEAF